MQKTPSTDYLTYYECFSRHLLMSTCIDFLHFQRDIGAIETPQFFRCLVCMNLYPLFFTTLAISLFHFEAIASEKLVIDGSTGVKPLIESLAVEYQKSHSAPQIEIGSGLKPEARVHALINKDIDIAMASHGIDIQHVSAKGLTVHRIAKVAVVMGVNQSVNIRNISYQQLCDIYGGKIENWQDLGGENQPIIPFIRPFNEVDTEVILEQVSCFASLKISPQIETRKKSGQMARAIAQPPGAIGMTTLIRVQQSKGKIRALSLNNIKPDTSNLLEGNYTLTRDLFLITPAEPDKKTRRFLAFIRSQNGSRNIISNNAVPAR